MKRTFEEPFDSDLFYGEIPSKNFAKETVPFPEFSRFLEDKKLKEDCSDLRKCIERMVTKRDISIIHNPCYVNRDVRELGTNFQESCLLPS